VKVLLFAAIIASNAYFLISWTRNILPMIIDTLRRRLTRTSYQTRPSIPDKLSKGNSGDLSDKRALSNLSISEVSATQGRISRMSDVVPDNSPYIAELQEIPDGRITPFVE